MQVKGPKTIKTLPTKQLGGRKVGLARVQLRWVDVCKLSQRMNLEDIERDGNHEHLHALHA